MGFGCLQQLKIQKLEKNEKKKKEINKKKVWGIFVEILSLVAGLLIVKKI